jgi:hypothetical protein
MMFFLSLRASANPSPYNPSMAHNLPGVNRLLQKILCRAFKGLNAITRNGKKKVLCDGLRSEGGVDGGKKMWYRWSSGAQASLVGPSSRPAIPAIPAKSVDNSCGGVLTFTGEFGMLCDSCDKCARG